MTDLLTRTDHGPVSISVSPDLRVRLAVAAAEARGLVATIEGLTAVYAEAERIAVEVPGDVAYDEALNRFFGESGAGALGDAMCQVAAAMTTPYGTWLGEGAWGDAMRQLGEAPTPADTPEAITDHRLRERLASATAEANDLLPALQRICAVWAEVDAVAVNDFCATEPGECDDDVGRDRFLAETGADDLATALQRLVDVIDTAQVLA